MKRYQLAKIVSWAGQLQSRKRLQKVVYMLQSADCPLEADYTLHHYGPYSEEVARLADEMVRSSLLVEEASANGVGTQYTYQLAESTQERVRALEATESGSEQKKELDKFEQMAKELLTADLKQLEYASTIIYFRRQGCDWDTAVEKAITFKKTESVRASLKLARKVMI